MIEFKPCVGEKASELLRKVTLSENSCVYTAFESGEEVGCCACNIENTLSEIVLLEYDDKKQYIGEGLVKSALNFAAGKGAYIALCSENVRQNHVLPFGFTPSDRGYTGEIPEILMGKCHKFGNL